MAGVHEAASLVYFTGTPGGPLESNLYCVRFVPGSGHPLQDPVRLTYGRGKHVVVLSHQMQSFIDIQDSLASLPHVLLCSLHDGNLITLYDQPSGVPRFKKLESEAPEIVQIKANDGSVLYAALYKPDERRFGPPVVLVYSLSDSWINTVNMRAQFLRSKGILLWKSDNRGSARCGLNFEGALKHNFGHIDAEDQLSGAKWLIKQGLAKAGTISLYGWSYSGYLSAMTLARFPDVFCCAVAGVPVTSWDGYDTFKTEKYMGLPSENPAGMSSDQYASWAQHQREAANSPRHDR